MKFNQLEYFCEVAQTKSFNKAARNLYTSPSNVMSAINSLEDELGYKLFERSSRGVTLTEIGQRILADTTKILNIKSRWENDGQVRSAVTDVSILAIPCAYHGIIPEIVARTQLLHPRIACDVRELFDWEINDVLPFHTNSLAITYVEKNVEDRDFLAWANNWNIDVVTLCDDGWKVFVGADHPLAVQSEISIQDMLPYKICCSTSPVYNNFYNDIYALGARAGGDQKRCLFVRDSYYMLHAVANHGYISALPALFKESAYVRSRRIVVRDLLNADYGMKMVLYHPKKSNLSEEQQVVIDVIGQCFDAYQQGVLLSDSCS